MQSVFLVQSFLTFAPRFMYRHPTKLGQLLEHWRDYSGRFQELGRLTDQDMDRVETLFNELDGDEQLFRELGGFWRMLIYDIVMYMLVRMMRPRIVVETGVEHGVSSWIYSSPWSGTAKACFIPLICPIRTLWTNRSASGSGT